MMNQVIINNKKKKVKRLSSTSYYPSAYISNPCDQLFGPAFDTSLANNETNQDDLNISSKSNHDSILSENTTNVENELHIAPSHIPYIPAPKYNKTQNGILEEFFKKSRFPKQSDLKLLAQRLNVMESDVEVCFLITACF